MDFMTKTGRTVLKEYAGKEIIFFWVSTDLNVNFRAGFKEALSGAAEVTSEPHHRSDISFLCSAIFSLLTGYPRSVLSQMFSVERTKPHNQKEVPFSVVQWYCLPAVTLLTSSLIKLSHTGSVLTCRK